MHTCTIIVMHHQLNAFSQILVSLSSSLVKMTFVFQEATFVMILLNVETTVTKREDVVYSTLVLCLYKKIQVMHVVVGTPEI